MHKLLLPLLAAGSITGGTVHHLAHTHMASAHHFRYKKPSVSIYSPRLTTSHAEHPNTRSFHPHTHVR